MLYIIFMNIFHIWTSWQAHFSGSMFRIIGCNPKVLLRIDPAQNNHPTAIAQLACKLRAIRCHADTSRLLFTEVSLHWTSLNSMRGRWDRKWEKEKRMCKTKRKNKHYLLRAKFVKLHCLCHSGLEKSNKVWIGHII